MGETILTWAITSGCTAVLTAIVTYFKTKKATEKKRKVELEEQITRLEFAVLSILRKSIINSYEKYKDKGYCPIYAKETLEREYDSYHALGGNDVATRLYDFTMKLPTEPPNDNKTED